MRLEPHLRLPKPLPKIGGDSPGADPIGLIAVQILLSEALDGQSVDQVGLHRPALAPFPQRLQPISLIATCRFEADFKSLASIKSPLQKLSEGRVASISVVEDGLFPNGPVCSHQAKIRVTL
jgi:hypothetical protein